MKCHGLWYGGSSYAPPDGHSKRDWEPFDSLKDAARTFAARADFDPRFPCVDEEAAEMHVYFSEEYHEDGPDRIIKFGPRGGIKVEAA